MKKIIENSPQLASLAENEDCCLICCQKQLNAKSNGCQHLFCSDCLQKWAKTHRTCPVCRTKFTGLLIKQKEIRKTARCLIVNKTNFLSYGMMCSEGIVMGNKIPIIQVFPILCTINTCLQI